MKKTSLNANTSNERLAALKKLQEEIQSGALAQPARTDYVNNHIHTIYSFSPYSPTTAAYTAWINGLNTAGIMDHDSVAGCREFIQAGKILNMSTTVGFECRCTAVDSPFAGESINNPDQPGVLYTTCHGIPHQNINTVQQWLTPFREKRAGRILGMTGNVNQLLKGSGITLDFDRDILLISQYKDGGTVTERHLLYALATKIIGLCSDGPKVVAFLKTQFGIDTDGKNRQILLDEFGKEHYEYYLLGILKSELTARFYIDAAAECPDVRSFVKFVKQIGAIPAYPYLGDVGESVTGDKKAQRFEDRYLDELIPWIKEIGFEAVTYMPSRNTAAQLQRLMGLCRKNDLFQISGEDINTPFQPFVCEALRQADYQHLITSTWALIGHEKAATISLTGSMFSPKTCEKFPSLEQRIKHYAILGKTT